MEIKITNSFNENSLESFLSKIENIEKITIGSAFLNDYGVEYLEKISIKEKIPKDNFKIYLGKSFSNIKPSTILKRLFKFSHVNIVNYNNAQIFHSKICLITLKNQDYQCIIGSSNYTYGGLANNLEFNLAIKPEKNDFDQIRIYFMRLDTISRPLDSSVIENYEKIEAQLQEIELNNRHFKKIFDTVSSLNDPFKENDYNFNGQYFNFKDYECLFPKNAAEKKITHRLILQSKLLELNKNLVRKINSYNLWHHWSEKHITSLPFPCVYNYNRVDWMGIRYGKSKIEIDKLNGDSIRNDDYEIYGFQKHGCIQYSLDANNFSISIFHAVPFDAVDRFYLHEKLREKENYKSIIDELSKYTESNYTWYIDNQEFQIRNGGADALMKFYINHDKDGVFSYFRKNFLPNDPLISENLIESTILTEINRLNDLYNLLVYRI